MAQTIVVCRLRTVLELGRVEKAAPAWEAGAGRGPAPQRGIRRAVDLTRPRECSMVDAEMIEELLIAKGGESASQLAGRKRIRPVRPCLNRT